MQREEDRAGGQDNAKRHKQQQGGGQPSSSSSSAAAAPAAAAAAPVDWPLPPGGVHIDGSLLEGGGQILRNASALAAILGKPLKVDNIRAGRHKPGLRPQHLTGLQLIAELSGGQLQGGAVGSSCITLAPGRLLCGSHVADTRTAGSCMLLAQSALPALLFAGSSGRGDTAAVAGAADAAAAAEEPAPAASELDLRGGTDAAMAPPVGYFTHVLLPTLRARLGITAGLSLQRRGFYPRGQGRCLLTVQPLAPGARLPALDLTERGAIAAIDVRAFTAGRVASHVGQRMAAAAESAIKARLAACGLPAGTPLSVECAHEPPERAFGDGCGLLVTARSATGCLFGASGLGERGVRAEDVGQRAADELMDALDSGACTDEWLQDQLVVFMALAQGRSRLLTGEPTLHARTACMVAKAMTGAKFSVAPAPGRPGLWLVECKGAAVAAPLD